MAAFPLCVTLAQFDRVSDVCVAYPIEVPPMYLQSNGNGSGFYARRVNHEHRRFSITDDLAVGDIPPELRSVIFNVRCVGRTFRFVD